MRQTPNGKERKDESLWQQKKIVLQRIFTRLLLRSSFLHRRSLFVHLGATRQRFFFPAQGFFRGLEQDFNDRGCPVVCAC